jgi:undecaprenyl diphosphate synthase
MAQPTDNVSSTQAIPNVGDVPRHVAIIMDGNGRWARSRFMPRVAGHKRGVTAVRETVKACGELGIQYLTLFAFSSENWRRPADEVSVLMQLFLRALEQEVAKLHTNNIRFKVVGDLTPFDPKIVQLIHNAVDLTKNNKRLTLTVAVNYGGRWDILQAANKAAKSKAQAWRASPGINGSIDSVVSTENATPVPQFDKDLPASGFSPITEAEISENLAMHYAPEPDLFIRTGGEERISNFLLWQLAYTELYFTNELWPDFNRASLNKAVESYRARERRFGRTSEQLEPTSSALSANATAA